MPLVARPIPSPCAGSLPAESLRVQQIAGSACVGGGPRASKSNALPWLNSRPISPRPPFRPSIFSAFVPRPRVIRAKQSRSGESSKNPDRLRRREEHWKSLLPPRTQRASPAFRATSQVNFSTFARSHVSLNSLYVLRSERKPLSALTFRGEKRVHSAFVGGRAEPPLHKLNLWVFSL